MQKGELDRTQAFMEGKIKAEGDLGLLIQLEDILSKIDGAK
jgi:putative sterol carrier protein